MLVYCVALSASPFYFPKHDMCRTFGFLNVWFAVVLIFVDVIVCRFVCSRCCCLVSALLCDGWMCVCRGGLWCECGCVCFCLVVLCAIPT